jgi:aminobenzoyl-glutamate utilization protein B
MPGKNNSTQWPEIDKALTESITQHADKVWAFSESGFEELRSSSLLVDWITSEGFTIVDDKAAGLDTAWVASFGSGSPVIGILVEYDALPGLGNEAVCSKTLRKDGTTNGHGCGHNLIGTGAIGAAIALKRRMEKENVAGTLKVFGCPAEELLAGKSYMANKGLFDSLDACLHWHPYNLTMPFNFSTTACADIQFEWRGKSAHSGAQPWDGRSALHASELFAAGINAMREHIIPEARMHYFVASGGEAVNVVPDHTRVMFRYRGPSASNVKENTEWVREIARGAAMMTQTEVKITDFAACYDILPNQVLADKMGAITEQLGVPEWSEEEQEFARAIQRECNQPEDGMFTIIAPDPKGAPIGGSSDVGDISYITPTMGMFITGWPLNIPPHHWGCTATHGMSIGHKSATKAAYVIAETGYELFTDAALLAAAKAEFLERSGGKPYESLCSDEFPPAALSASLRHKCNPLSKSIDGLC